MKHKFEKRTLKILWLFGIISFFNLMRKPALKDWLIIFFLKSYIASFLDNILVRKGYIRYPVNLMKSFDVSVLFSYLIFPVMCVYFNQVTRNLRMPGIMLVSLLFSIPSAIAENWLEKNTKLISYKKSWTSFHSFASIASTFLAVRFLISLIRKIANQQSSSY